MDDDVIAAWHEFARLCPDSELHTLRESLASGDPSLVRGFYATPVPGLAGDQRRWEAEADGACLLCRGSLEPGVTVGELEDMAKYRIAKSEFRLLSLIHWWDETEIAEAARELLPLIASELKRRAA